MSSPAMPRKLDRRTFLLGVCATAIAACTESDNAVGDQPTTAETLTSNDTSTTGTSAPEGTLVEPTAGTEIPALDAAQFDEVAICRMTPESTTGPFPSLELLDRRDIHEGYPGHPLRLGVRVVDAECQPVPGAQVEVWHTDASGDYSSYTDDGSGKDEGEGSTFCRGMQESDENGIVEFQTIYPGWYEGRAVHIHSAVWLDGQRTHTGQLYFDEAYTESVYATGEYTQFGLPDTPWSQDGLIGEADNDGTAIALGAAETYNGPGTLGLANLTIEA